MPSFSIPRITVEGLIIALLALALCWQTVRIEGFKVGPLGFDGLEAKAARAKEYKRQLDDLAEQSKRKIEETGKTVDRVIYRDLPDADRRARRVETAPLEGNCKSPKAVLEADL